jgi:hypothetical protein
MVKRIIAVLMFFLTLSGGKSYANEQNGPIDFEVRIIDQKPLHPGSPRSPIIYPVVCKEDYEIEIEAPHAVYVLNIVSGTTIVYSVVVPENVSLVELPTSLSGSYELQFVQDNLCFYGYITLQ